MACFYRGGGALVLGIRHETGFYQSVLLKKTPNKKKS